MNILKSVAKLRKYIKLWWAGGGSIHLSPLTIVRLGYNQPNRYE